MTIDSWENKKVIKERQKEEEKKLVEEAKAGIKAVAEILKKQASGAGAESLSQKLEEILACMDNGETFGPRNFEGLEKIMEVMRNFNPLDEKNVAMSAEEIVSKFNECEHENSENCDGCRSMGEGCCHAEIEQY